MPKKKEKVNLTAQLISENIVALRRCTLLKGLDETGIARLLCAVGAKLQRRERDEFYIIQGDEHCDIYLMLKGSCVGEHVAEDGTVAAINEFLPGDVFGDMLSGSGEASPVSVRALCDSSALCFSFESLMGAQNAEHERTLMLRNFVSAASHKYFSLTRRIELLCMPRMRNRIMRYLEQRMPQRGAKFAIEHDRAQMAAYLGCERSALSRELMRMKADGLIDYHKRVFCVLI